MSTIVNKKNYVYLKKLCCTRCLKQKFLFAVISSLKFMLCICILFGTN